MVSIKVTLFTLLIASLTVFCQPDDESVTTLVYSHDSDAGHLTPDFSTPEQEQPSLLEEEEVHERVIRSPWGGRRRRRWVRVRKVARNVGRAVRRTVRKVGRAVRKVPKVVKRVGRQAGRLVRRTVRKASRAVRKTVKEIKRAGKRIKKIPRKTGKAIGKIKDKLKEKIAKLIKKKEEEEEEEEVIIVDPPTDETDEGLVTTVSTIPTTKGCDSDCQELKMFEKNAEFFKQSHCAFYYAKRHHRDFFLDRNKNASLDMWMGDIAREAVGLYAAFAEPLKSVKKDVVIKNEQQLRQDCVQKAIEQCKQKTARDILEFYNLRCFKSCAGFTGCSTQDIQLVKVIDKAMAAHDKQLNQQATL